MPLRSVSAKNDSHARHPAGFFLVIFVLSLLTLASLLIGFFRLRGSKDDLPPTATEISGSDRSFLRQNQKDISYGAQPQQVFDFFPPKPSPADGIVLLVHGGSWTSGDKEELSIAANFFSQKNLAVANLNYRLAPSSSYDAPLEDIAAVIDTIAAQPARYGLKDKYRVFLVGEEAGAHLGAMFSLRDDAYGTRPIDGFVGLNGIYDLTSPENTISGDLSRPIELFLKGMSAQEVSPINRIPENEKTSFLLLDNSANRTQSSFFHQALSLKDVLSENDSFATGKKESLFQRISQNDAVAQRIIFFIQSFDNQD